jgi:excisionase family DNA binding protein
MMIIKVNENRVSVREFAMECGRNTETIRRWIWSGKLPAEKLGNQLFIKKSDLKVFLGKDGEMKKIEDWLIRAKALRERMKARGVTPIDSGELIRKMREERTDGLEQSMP